MAPLSVRRSAVVCAHSACGGVDAVRRLAENTPPMANVRFGTTGEERDEAGHHRRARDKVFWIDLQSFYPDRPAAFSCLSAPIVAGGTLFVIDGPPANQTVLLCATRGVRL